MKTNKLKRFNEMNVPRIEADYRTIEEYWRDLNNEEKIDHLKRLYINTILYDRDFTELPVWIRIMLRSRFMSEKENPVLYKTKDTIIFNKKFV